MDYNKPKPINRVIDDKWCKRAIDDICRVIQRIYPDEHVWGVKKDDDMYDLMAACDNDYQFVRITAFAKGWLAALGE